VRVGLGVGPLPHLALPLAALLVAGALLVGLVGALGSGRP
jgi:hypothetical protein